MTRDEIEARGLRVTPHGRGFRVSGAGVDLFVVDLAAVRADDLRDNHRLDRPWDAAWLSDAQIRAAARRKSDRR
jgi:hypothetical protein